MDLLQELGWDVIMKYLQDKGVDIFSATWGNYDNVSLTNLRGYYTNIATSHNSNITSDGFKSVNNLQRNRCKFKFTLPIDHR